MSKIVLTIKEQINAHEDFVLYHCDLIAYCISEHTEGRNIISYNKKGRALDLLTSFRLRIIDDLDKIENLKVVYLVIRDDGIYVCIKPSKFIEKIVTLDHVFKKVTQAVTASLHFYW